jgi:hypothetical protein
VEEFYDAEIEKRQQMAKAKGFDPAGPRAVLYARAPRLPAPK